MWESPRFRSQDLPEYTGHARAHVLGLTEAVADCGIQIPLEERRVYLFVSLAHGGEKKN